MSDRPVIQPGPDHPITVEPTDGRVVVRIGDTVLADTTASLTLQEASYPPVQYVPIGDVDGLLLHKSDTTSYCPYKGEASYYDVTIEDTKTDDVIWYYPKPHDAVSVIENHVAFYPDKVTIEMSA